MSEFARGARSSRFGISYRRRAMAARHTGYAARGEPESERNVRVTTEKRQAEIPGMERPSIPQIDDAARQYVDVRDERMGLTKREVAAKATLADALHEHESTLERNEDGELVYVFNDGDQKLTCVLASKESIKVRVASLYDPFEDEGSEIG